MLPEQNCQRKFENDFLMVPVCFKQKKRFKKKDAEREAVLDCAGLLALWPAAKLKIVMRCAPNLWIPN